MSNMVSAMARLGRTPGLHGWWNCRPRDKLGIACFLLGIQPRALDLLALNFLIIRCCDYYGVLTFILPSQLREKCESYASRHILSHKLFLASLLSKGSGLTF
jgi:hypothetical protein